MRIANLWAIGLTLATMLVLFGQSVAVAQTVVNVESSLVGSTLVVNNTPTVARCSGGSHHCFAESPLFTPVQVSCPAAIGQTCTFDISVVAQFIAGSRNLAPGISSFTFLVDDAAPQPGPTDAKGHYHFLSHDASSSFPLLTSYPAQVVANVTNTTSQNHTVSVGIACWGKGCYGKVNVSSTRIDVFEP
jgi:hypothetical protein